LDRNGNQVLETLNAVRFIGASEANPYTATYTTDKEGKFDFQLRYPKAYATWLSVQVGATTTLSSTQYMVIVQFHCQRLQKILIKRIGHLRLH
jgi:hypothetical protein